MEHFPCQPLGHNPGIEAEVRAGDAVRLAQPDGIPDTEQGEQLRQKVKESVDAPFLVSL